MQTLLKVQPVVENIRSVIKNNMGQGRVIKKIGRYSDCLVFIEEGEAHYSFGDRKVCAKSGNVLYLPKDSLYNIHVITENYKVIFVDFDFIKTRGEAFEADVFCNISQRGVNMDFNLLYQYWIEKKPTYRMRCLSLLYKIIADILQRTIVEYHSSTSFNKIKRSVEYMNENFFKPDFSVETAAAISRISAVHFRRLYKAQFNISPIKHVNLMRIERAKELLANDELSVTSIAELCGYTDIYYFCKSFKAMTGKTPGEYRQETILT